MYLRVIAFCIAISSVNSAPAVTTDTSQETQTAINQGGVHGTIEHRILSKPHNLFVGRCKPDAKILHQENVILNNDGKSHVAAGIRMNVEADNVEITCVKIYDEVPDGAGGYAKFVAGGVGSNYIEFSVMTEYGRGFHFFVQIYGDEVKRPESE